MSWFVPLADLDYGEAEAQAVLDVLQRRWLTMGSVTQEFEAQFARYVGAKHAIAVSNATVALHLACRALDIGSGDHVIVPSLSFVATANAVLYTGAQVRFADILGEDELNISPQAIEASLTPQTRALIVMHYAGYPCRMDEICAIAERHGIAVIEDAAHATGASLQGRHMGTWGNIGCFSFFSNKNLATGEGGMLVTDDDEIARKLRLLRSHGMTSLTWDRHQGHAYSYDVTELGYNYRIDEMRSALGLVQLGKLAANNHLRKSLVKGYWQALQDQPLHLPFQSISEHDGLEPAYHIFPILLRDAALRLPFMDHLRQEGVQSSIHYPPIHLFSYYRKHYPGVELPLTEALASRQVTLPLYPGMSEVQQAHVIKAVENALVRIAQKSRAEYVNL